MVYCDFSMSFRKEIVEMYDALTVAEYVIKYSTLSGMPVSNLRLQKVLYFIQAEFMVSTNSECFNDRIEAWDLGPVVPTVYRKYKVFGASSIPIDSSKDAERIFWGSAKSFLNIFTTQGSLSFWHQTHPETECPHRQAASIYAAFRFSRHMRSMRRLPLLRAFRS